jgi:hypothetical protein
MEEMNEIYNLGIKLIIEILQTNQKISFMISSENEQTISNATTYIIENNFDESRIYFSQIKV